MKFFLPYRVFFILTPILVVLIGGGFLTREFFLITQAAETAPDGVKLSLIKERREQLEKELQNLEAQIAVYQNTLIEKQKEATTLERDIAILDTKIEKARLEIRVRTIAISNLADAINDRSETIISLQKKIDRLNESLAELMRKVNEIDGTPLVEALASYSNLSEFFANADSINTLQDAIQKSYDDIRGTKEVAAKERDDLNERKSEELELKKIQELEKKRIEEAEAEKKRILTVTRGKEKEYKKLVDARKKDAASIRSQLFLLTGSPAIPFEKAVEYALTASRATGVRPAFLLGVIAEESNLGANVGKGNWKEDLSHQRCAGQRAAFQEITKELGLDPDLMPVSRKTWYGYCGGAMGPAQFMPTTWKLYRAEVAQVTGHNPPNPWNPLDAFVASALLLRDNGASAGTYQAEWKAALKYLAGSNWNKPAYRFYGDDVMALAAKYDEQINILQSLASLSKL